MVANDGSETPYLLILEWLSIVLSLPMHGKGYKTLMAFVSSPFAAPPLFWGFSQINLATLLQDWSFHFPLAISEFPISTQSCPFFPQLLGCSSPQKFVKSLAWQQDRKQRLQHHSIFQIIVKLEPKEVMESFSQKRFLTIQLSLVPILI